MLAKMSKMRLSATKWAFNVSTRYQPDFFIKDAVVEYVDVIITSFKDDNLDILNRQFVMSSVK